MAIAYHGYRLSWLSLIDSSLFLFMLRRISRFDAFPKMDRDVMDSSDAGGLVSIVVWAILAYLSLFQLIQYRSIQHKYEFLVDQSRSQNLGLVINVDVTVAMECKCSPPLTQMLKSMYWILPAALSFLTIMSSLCRYLLLIRSSITLLALTLSLPGWKLKRRPRVLMFIK
jgi:hypothetical protein